MESRDLPVVAALVALSASVALAFRQVIDGSEWIAPLLVAAAIPSVVGALVRPRRQGPWLEVLVSAAITGIGIVLLTPGGPAPGAVLDRIRAGWDVLQTAPAPIPYRPGIVVLAVVVVWAVAAIADVLTFRHGASLGAIAPGVVVVIWCTALGTDDGAGLTVVLFGVASVVFLGLQHQRLLDRHRARIGTAGRLVDAPRLLAAGVIAGIVVVSMSVAAAVALPGADDPLLQVGPLADDSFSGSRTYKTNIDPVLNVGDQLNRPEPADLFTVESAEPQYWRTTAMDVYRSGQGGQWVVKAEGDDAVGQGLDESVPRDALVQRYRIGPLGERWMPAAYRPVRVNRDDVLVVRSSSSLVTGRDSVAGLEYTVRSDVPPREFDAEARRTAASPVPDDLQQYLQLPSTLPPVIVDTARSIAGAIADPISQATALRDFFRDGSFTYDTNPDLGDGDEAAIARFLEDRRGFCVQFATAYVLMARELGIPARLAVGYAPGAFDDATATFTVTTNDAHAWPELYFAGMGWTNMFDPTPPSDLPGGSAVPNEIPPVAVPATQTPTSPTTVAGAPPATVAAPPATVPPSGQDPTAGGGDAPQGGGVEISADDSGEKGDGALVWVAVIVALGVALLVAPVVAILLWKRRRRARRRRDGDARHAIVGAWQEALDALVDHRVATSDSETPLELADRVPDTAGDAAGPPMQALAEAYTEARYATRDPDEAQADAAWRDVDDLEAALAESFGSWARVRARLSPGSLVQEREHDEQLV
jgi:transglutaminase-like putative cysteine protease